MTLRFEISSALPSARVNAWDEFVQRSPRGHYILLSTWLRAYEAFGMRARILHAIDTQTGLTVGGAGFVTAGASPFHFASVPFGPIVELGQEACFPHVLAALVERCGTWGAAFLQVQLPHAADPSATCMALVDPSPALPSIAEPGAPFRFALAPDLFQLVDLAGPDDADAWRTAILKRFRKDTAHNVKASMGGELELVDARDEGEIRRAFAIIEANGREQGYATRTWAQFGASLIEQVAAGHARVLIATHGGRDVGAHYGVIAGQRYSYIMGGTVRLEKRLSIGHFLNFRAIELARQLRLDAYDFTSRGTPGVLVFKTGFRPRCVSLAPPVHFVFSRARVALFHFAYGLARKHKRRVATLVNRLSTFAKRR